MKKKKIIARLNEIASKETSKWLEKAKYREANRDWLDISAKIAVKILRELRKKKLTQIELAKKLNVSPQYINKIVKGRENLSLETISKIEKALETSLISISSFDSSKNYSFKNLVGNIKVLSTNAKPIVYVNNEQVIYSKFEIEEKEIHVA